MKKHLALIVIALSGVMAFPAYGTIDSTKKKKEPVKKEEKKPEDKFGDLVKKCKKREGLLTFYTDTVTGKTYLEIQKSQLNQEFIYFNYIENAPVETGYIKGLSVILRLLFSKRITKDWKLFSQIRTTTTILQTQLASHRSQTSTIPF